jgi:hypothetical protein
MQKIQAETYVQIHVGNVLEFGYYIVCGPLEFSSASIYKAFDDDLAALLENKLKNELSISI